MTHPFNQFNPWQGHDTSMTRPLQTLGSDGIPQSSALMPNIYLNVPHINQKFNPQSDHQNRALKALMLLKKKKIVSVLLDAVKLNFEGIGSQLTKL